MELVLILAILFSFTNVFEKYYKKVAFYSILLIIMEDTVISDPDRDKTFFAVIPTVVFTIFRAWGIQFFDAAILCVLSILMYSLHGYLIYAAAEKSYVSGEVYMACLILFVIFSSGFAGTSCYKLHKAMRMDFLHQRLLNIEEKRADDILSSIYPNHITKRIQNGEISIFDEELDVSVIFCNICEFEELTKLMTSEQLISILDILYSMFDLLCLKHGVQKVETVGRFIFVF